MTEQSAFYAPQFLRHFIELYHSHPCLWQIKNPNYGNKRMRKAAYNDLVNLTRTIVQDCDEDYIKKKIDSLRGSYRRETKKVIHSKALVATGLIGEGIYTPKLWYYDLLTFVADQEETNTRTYPESSVRSPVQIQMRVRPSEGSLDKDNTGSNDMYFDNTESDDIMYLDNGGSSDVYLNNGGALSDSDAVVDPLPLHVFLSDGQKKRRLKSTTASDDSQSVQTLNILHKAINILDKKEDEFGLIGANVTAKLRRMCPDQVIYAETLIGQVLASGLLGKLSHKTALNHGLTDRPTSSRNSVSSQLQREEDSDNVEDETNLY